MNRIKKRIMVASLAILTTSVLGIVALNNLDDASLFAQKLYANDYNSLSVTFDSSSTVKSGSISSSSCVLASNLQISGIEVRATIFNSSIPQTGSISRFNNDTATVDFNIYSNEYGVEKFQNLTSIEFGYKNENYSGSFKVMWSSNNVSWTTISVTAGSASQSLPSGAHYVKLVNENAYAQFSSFVLNYSCTDTPAEEYSISYYGMDSNYNTIPLEGIDTSSLIYSSTEGSVVSFTPVASSGYTYLGAFGYSENVEDISSDDNGTITFTMPAENVEFIIVTQSNMPTLSSISVNGQTAEFTVGDDFVFGGVVTATYSNGSTADVTSNATFSGYDMSAIGNQTVTVSYTENGVSKNTTYAITISNSETQDIILNGTYNYYSRKNATDTTHKDWTGCMTIVFNSDGTCTWRNVRTSLGSNYDCKVNFTYKAFSDGANISIEMALTSYDFLKDNAYNNEAKSFSGGAYDRPIDGGFGGTTSKNNSGVMSLDLTVLTINTFDQAHSYEVYDTLTFTLAS